jgi:KilA-N domain
MAKIKIKDIEVTVVKVANADYICLTNMIKAKDGEFFVTDWLRNRNTLEYIGIWEQINNPAFNYGEFATIKSKSGLNNFKISVKEFAEKTNAVSLQAKAGRRLANMENLNAVFINEKMPQPQPNSHTANESIASGRK